MAITPFITDSQATQKIQEAFNLLDGQIDGIASGYRGTIAIGEVKTEDGIYTPTTAGTYPDADGLVYDPEGVDKGKQVQFIKTGSNWVKNSVDIGFEVVDEVVKDSQDAVTSGAVEAYAAPKSAVFEYKKIYNELQLTEVGFVRADGTESDEPVPYKKSKLLDISNYSELTITTKLNSPSIGVVVFYDENEDYISGITRLSENIETYKLAKPVNAKFAKFSSNSADRFDFEVGIDNFSKITENKTTIKRLKDELIIKNNPIGNGELLISDGFIRPVGTSSTSNAYKKTDLLNVAGATKITISTITGNTSVSPCVFYDENEDYISGISTAISTQQTIEIIDIPVNTKYIISSASNSARPIFSIQIDTLISKVFSGSKNINYVSNSGNDLGDGSINDPFKTMEKAGSVTSPFGKIIMKEGDYLIDNKILLKNNLYAKNGDRVRLLFGRKIDFAVLESGNTNVYSIPYTETIANNYFLWQHDINDEESEIQINERHPLQKGRKYRLRSKRIYKASSVSEIENNTSKLMWFTDGVKLYFSKQPGSDLSLNPIVIPDNLQGVALQNDVDLSNIEILYAPFFSNGKTALVRNCSFGYNNAAGCVVFDNTYASIYYNCEIFACNRDGANGHSLVPLNNFSQTTEATFKDCWIHSNGDDGESCHEYSKTTHFGGLIEYNANGVTPAFGGGSTCYNTVSRQNGNHPWTAAVVVGAGFGAVGAPNDGGESTDIWCYNCLSENNKIGFKSQNSGNTFVNCISKDDGIAFQGAGQQLNCVTL